MFSIRRRLVVLFVGTILYLILILILSKNETKKEKNFRILYLVRTSARFHSTRFLHQVESWINEVLDDFFVVTDFPAPKIDSKHRILTKDRCRIDEHSMSSLCCKTAHDFQIFNEHLTEYDWFCHFDDDQYVNVENLRQFLSKFDAEKAFYIGRNSWPNPVKRTRKPFPLPFWFGTLGAGVCFSRRSIELLRDQTDSISKFVDGCLRENYHDDIYLGFLVASRLNISLTKTDLFHSHIEKDFYRDEKFFSKIFTEQITFGFRFPDRYPKFLPNIFSPVEDRYRMKSLHCLLYPKTNLCRERFLRYFLNLTV